MQPTTERGSVGSTTSPLHPGRAAGRRTAVVATATLLALIGAACSTPSGPPSAPTSTAAPSGSTTTAPTSALKTIDKAALQAMVDQTADELLIPGCLVMLRTPQGEFVAASGTTKLGTKSLPAADTHFRIASITKTMTSAATLLLAQEGKLSLDDPVTKYVPGVPNGDNISIAQLLEMRSGLYSFTDAPALTTSLDNDPTRVWKPQQLLDIAFAQPPNFAPGADYEYSNTNYVLLGLIVEKLDGKPIATVFEERFFKPLGMKDTLFPAAASQRHPRTVRARVPVRRLLHHDVRHSAVHPRHGRRSPGREAAAEGLHRRQPLLLVRGRGQSSPPPRTSRPGSRPCPAARCSTPSTNGSGRTAPRSSTPPTPTTGTGTASPSSAGASTSSTCTAGRPPVTTPRQLHDPDADMTLVIWSNLTMSLGQQVHGRGSHAEDAGSDLRGVAGAPYAGGERLADR